MPGRSEKTEDEGLSPREWRAVELLISGLSVQKVATEIEISESTLHRWLAKKDFQTAFRSARRKAFDANLSSIYSHVPKAIDTLAELLDCGHSPTRVKAALGIIDKATGTISYADLAAEIERLTELAEASNAKLGGASETGPFGSPEDRGGEEGLDDEAPHPGSPQQIPDASHPSDGVPAGPVADGLPQGPTSPQGDALLPPSGEELRERRGDFEALFDDP